MSKERGFTDGCVNSTQQSIEFKTKASNNCPRFGCIMKNSTKKLSTPIQPRDRAKIATLIW